ncbi:MAG: hypothetical protein ABI237_06740 [Ginsengibacter sp.]
MYLILLSIVADCFGAATFPQFKSFFMPLAMTDKTINSSFHSSGLLFMVRHCEEPGRGHRFT